jgi:REP-associated tyrosine transposase
VLDEWCVMPNHLHGILVLTGRGGSRTAPTGDFKTVSTKHINRLRNTPGAVVWQRNFWERVIRDDAEMDRIRVYIRDNPANSVNDALNAAVGGAVREPPLRDFP